MHHAPCPESHPRPSNSVRKRSAALLVAMACSSSPGAAQGIPTPEAHLGRPVGGDFTLADWNEVSSYHRAVAERSDRVIVERIGTTTEGREFLMSVVADPSTLADLDRYRGLAAKVADPRGLSPEEREAVLEGAKPILMISLGMHSTETSPPQQGMELLHALATSDREPYRSARENLIVCILPCSNPDGLDIVVDHYRSTVGTSMEGSRPLELYQRYTGHDNNRDWFALSQVETRIVTEQLYHRWFPQVYWDAHEQGNQRERFFVPPYRDPLDPEIDAGIITSIDALGSRALMDMNRAGLSGIATGISYDMWWSGGNRNVPVRHNIIGLLTEAAGIRLGTPVFQPKSSLSAPRGLDEYAASNRFPNPWPGGWWRMRDIIDYENAFAESLLGSLAREPRFWLENAMEAAERAVLRGAQESPRAWVIPSDNRDRGAVRRFLDILLRSGLEVHHVKEAFEAGGRSWPAGSMIVRRDQPYGAHAANLFEVQRYPQDGDPPYDVSGWTLTALFGIERAGIEALPEADLVPVQGWADIEDVFGGSRPSLMSGELDMGDGESWRRAVSALTRRIPVAVDTRRGSLRLDGEAESINDRILMPRIGVYAPWNPSMDEGWLRWVLDDHGIPFERIRNETLRGGDLGEVFDVLVIPSISGRSIDEGRDRDSVLPMHARGLDPEGASAIEEFVRGGGRLVCLGSSSRWAQELFELPLEEVTTGPGASGFSCPGSVLRAIPRAHALTAELAPTQSIFFSNSLAWRATPEAGRLDVLLRIAPTRALVSGWIREPEVIEDQAVWVRARHGRGFVHLFGFRPQYRGWSQQSFLLLFRALFLDQG